VKRRDRIWWISGAVLILSAVIFSAAFPESEFAVVLFVLSVLWAMAAAALISRRIWRWMTYRVGVRLFITYVLVGVLPVLFAIAFAAIGLYILMGQYTSVRFGSELRRLRWELAHQCDMVLDRAESAGADSAVMLLEELAGTDHEPLPRVLWQARIGDREVGLEGGEQLPAMEWLSGDLRNRTAKIGDRAFGLISSGSASGDRVTALIPLDESTARAISGAWWFDVAFLIEEANDELDVEASRRAEDEPSVSGEGSVRFSVGGERRTYDELWPAWAGSEDGWLSRPLVIWFRVAVEIIDMETGAEIENGNLIALLRTSPSNVWSDFTLSRYELGTELWGALAGLATLFLLGYGLALAAAAAVVFSIARSTARLTHGARQVEKGNLDHRVPVKRRDQLGDLARSFNHMTHSVQSMLSDVAEKERLARELELAREIQESLLPGSRLDLGTLVLRATFQPAAEVGGDYFDVFPISDSQLVVTVGDVAGHGLSTGLLMASLKSSVAALVHEGYSGPTLIDKVNRLLMEQGHARTMVTMAVLDVDPVNGTLTVANAGHPPPFLVGGSGEPVELAVPALPMGNRLSRAAEARWAFPEDARVVLYSDGLVEAASPEGEPFGFDRLLEILRTGSDLDGEAMIRVILEDLTAFTDGAPLSDDLTLLVLERPSRSGS
jgi:serine phosphatase RsbU (regulator of sigma subunit)